MHVSLKEIWASPSTFHVVLVVSDNKETWVQICRASMPISEFPEDVLGSLNLALATDSPLQHDVPLF